MIWLIANYDVTYNSLTGGHYPLTLTDGEAQIQVHFHGVYGGYYDNELEGYTYYGVDSFVEKDFLEQIFIEFCINTNLPVGPLKGKTNIRKLSPEEMAQDWK